jgi:hypothetical protein
MLVLPAVVGAQTSRLESMLLRSDYVKDVTNIYPYPNTLPMVGNFVYGELGNVLVNSNTGSPETLDRGVGTVLNNLWDGRLGAWGLHLREETPAIGRGSAFGQPSPGVLGGDPNHHTHQSFELQWGQQFGTTTFGVKLNRSYTQEEIQLPGVTTTLAFDPTVSVGDSLARNIFGIGAGVGFELNPETSIDVAILYESRTFENSVSPPAAGFEDDGGTTYQINARMSWEYMPNWLIVPVLKYYSFDLSTKSIGGPTFDNSLSGWEVGAAGNWTLGSNDLFVLGLTFAQNKVDQQSDIFGIAGNFNYADTLEVTEMHTPQLFAALETNINSWLTLRFGATKGAFYSAKLEGRDLGSGGSVEHTFSDSPFEMAIGAGVKLGTLQIDTILNNAFPQTLGWLGSGLPGVYFPKVTATYSF